MTDSLENDRSDEDNDQPQNQKEMSFDLYRFREETIVVLNGHPDRGSGDLQNQIEMTKDLYKFWEEERDDLSADHIKHWACGYRPSDDLPGIPVLHEAARRGNVDVVRKALKVEKSDQPDSGGATPLQRAAAAGSLEAAKVLLANGADPTCAAEDKPPLYHAASSGSADAVKLLIKEGASVGREAENGRVPLQAAAAGGHLQVAKLLLEEGANPTQVTGGPTHLQAAASAGSVETVDLLLKAGADPSLGSGKADFESCKAPDPPGRGVWVTQIYKSPTGGWGGPEPDEPEEICWRVGSAVPSGHTYSGLSCVRHRVCRNGPASYRQGGQCGLLR